ncbi:MAG: hypothetical protein JSS43_15315 [Proteobacteria bacterium]|nr:hypothetical protein [Pseudomonadota bacterium]
MKYSPGILLAGILASACSSNPLPPPNSSRVSFDDQAQAVQLYVSNVQMPREAWLVDTNNVRYPLVLSLVSAPHVNYSAPPSIGLGLGGFGWNVGGGAGIDVPLGSPQPVGVDDQYIASARFAAPPDYQQRWPAYRIAVQVGPQILEVPCPPPAGS